LKGTVTINRVMHLTFIPKSIVIFAQVNKFVFLIKSAMVYFFSGFSANALMLMDVAVAFSFSNLMDLMSKDRPMRVIFVLAKLKGM
ncbi:MAG: hypothetical protein QM498_17110, partial [Desulfobacterium sp.]